MTLTKKELTRSAKDLRTKIGELSKTLDGEFKPFRSVCKELSDAKEKYNSALAAHTKKASDKNALKLTRAKETLSAAWKLYSDTYDKIDAQYKGVLLEYDRLVEAAEGLGAKELAKAKKEREDFISAHAARIAKARGDAIVDLPSFLAAAAKPASAAATAAPKSAPAAAPKSAPAVVTPATAPAATATVASVGIAPVTIDISAYVERAISATMDRLNVAMERKLDEYFAGLDMSALTSKINAAVERKVDECVAGLDVSAKLDKLTAAVDGKIDECVAGLDMTAKLDKLTAAVDGKIDECIAELDMTAKLDKLTAAVDAKIDEYVAGFEIPAPVIAPVAEPVPVVTEGEPAPAAEPAPVEIPTGVNTALVGQLSAAIKATNEMLRHLIGEQNHVYEKLRTMIASVEKLVSNVSAIGATYAEVLAAHSTLEETAKKVMSAQKEALAAEEAILREQSELVIALASVTAEPVAEEAPVEADEAAEPVAEEAPVEADEADEPRD